LADWLLAGAVAGELAIDEVTELYGMTDAGCRRAGKTLITPNGPVD